MQLGAGTGSEYPRSLGGIDAQRLPSVFPPLSPRVQQFVSALQALCTAHGVYLTPEYDSGMIIWDLDSDMAEYDTVRYIDCTRDAGTVSSPGQKE